MKEQEALDRGYRFTGIYEWNRRTVNDRANEIRKQGYKCYLVPQYATGYERSAGVRRGMVLGYSIYAEQKYFTDREKKDIQIRLSGVPGRKKSLASDYRQKFNELRQEEVRLRERLKKLESMNPKTRAIRNEILGIKGRLEKMRNPRKPSWDAWYGKRVKIKEGMREFIGKTGVVGGFEGEYLRVYLDEPVYIEGVGRVTDDLWMPYTVRKIKGNPGAEWHRDERDYADKRRRKASTKMTKKYWAGIRDAHSISVLESQEQDMPNPRKKRTNKRSRIALGSLVMTFGIIVGIGYLLWKKSKNV